VVDQLSESLVTLIDDKHQHCLGTFGDNHKVNQFNSVNRFIRKKIPNGNLQRDVS